MHEITIQEHLEGKQFLPPIGTKLYRPSIFKKGKMKYLEEMYEPAINLLYSYTYFPYEPIKNTSSNHSLFIETNELKVLSVGEHSYHPDLTTFVIYFECILTSRLFKIQYIDSPNPEFHFIDSDSRLVESLDDYDDVFNTCYAMNDLEYSSLVRKIKIDNLLRFVKVSTQKIL